MRRVYVFSFIVSLLSSTAWGQTLYNGSILYIGNNSVLYSADSIINNGTIINNGDIQVGGIWQNNGTYDPGTGQLTLTSSLPQVINHNDQSFTRLRIVGGGEKIFGADIYIVNELVLGDGILRSLGNSKLVFEDGAVISGGSDNSFIEGPVYHVGTGNKYFPVGIGSTFLPLEFENVTGVTPTLGVLLVSPNPNLAVQNDLLAVTDQQYWQLDILNGSFDGSRVILPLRDETFASSIDEVVIVQAPSIDLPFSSLGLSNSSGDLFNGFVTSEVEATDFFLTLGQINSEGNGSSDLTIYNAVSPNEDGLNDVFKILNIDQFPNNKVAIFTRWGDKVYEITGYDNVDKVFVGQSNVGKSYLLAEGTYYYVIDKGDGTEQLNGFLELRQ